MNNQRRSYIYTTVDLAPLTVSFRFLHTCLVLSYVYMRCVKCDSSSHSNHFLCWELAAQSHSAHIVFVCAAFFLHGKHIALIVFCCSYVTCYSLYYYVCVCVHFVGAQIHISTNNIIVVEIACVCRTTVWSLRHKLQDDNCFENSRAD